MPTSSRHTARPLSRILLQPATKGGFEITHSLGSRSEGVTAYVWSLREFCQKRGISFFAVSSNTDLQELLLKQLRQAEVWG